MGFFAGELQFILEKRVSHPQGSPWAYLTRLGVHPQQVDRLRKASEDIGLIATLPEASMRALRQSLDLTIDEWSRLQAGLEADTFLRLLLYHDYPLEEAANRANAVFAATLKERLTLNGDETKQPSHQPSLDDAELIGDEATEGAPEESAPATSSAKRSRSRATQSATEESASPHEAHGARKSTRATPGAKAK